MKNENEKYYVVEVNWTGPDQMSSRYIDYDRYEVTTEPPRNTSGDIQLSGCLGTNGDVSRYAHGEYDVKSAAEYAIIKMLDGDCRRHDEVNAAMELGVVALYRPGRYSPISDDILSDYIFRTVECNEISVPSGEITREQLNGVVRDLRKLLRDDGSDAPEDRIEGMLIDVCEIEMTTD
ncbi:hypothetical protein [Thiolapillus sp.]|uniref:hypothetical protein n=1 Tax=Thiolapillus sp. TaxID=2017437 RepID=UPI003AF54149